MLEISRTPIASCNRCRHLVMLRTLLLIGLATASSLRLDSLVSRRAAVAAVAGSLAVPWAAHAVDQTELDGVVARAKAGKLTTEGVIGRALLDDMVRSPLARTPLARTLTPSHASRRPVPAVQLPRSTRSRSRTARRSQASCRSIRRPVRSSRQSTPSSTSSTRRRSRMRAMIRLLTRPRSRRL